jgi:membrane-associated protein
VNDLLSWILDTVQSVDPTLRVLLAGVGMLLETSILIGLIVPGDTVVLVAATGVGNGFEFAFLLLAVIVGALAGESIGFALGRFFGPRIRASRLGSRLGERNWIRAEQYLARRGGIAVFVSRFLPVFHALIPLTVGMSAMSYRRFLQWTVPACAIWAGAYVSVGTLAAGSFRVVARELHFAGYLFAAVIAVFFAIVLVTRKLLERREARYMARADAAHPTAHPTDAHPTDDDPTGDDQTP